ALEFHVARRVVVLGPEHLLRHAGQPCGPDGCCEPLADRRLWRGAGREPDARGGRRDVAPIDFRNRHELGPYDPALRALALDVREPLGALLLGLPLAPLLCLAREREPRLLQREPRALALLLALPELSRLAALEQPEQEPAQPLELLARRGEAACDGCA